MLRNLVFLLSWVTVSCHPPCSPESQYQELLRVRYGSSHEDILANRRPCDESRPPPMNRTEALGVRVYDLFPFNAECDVLEVRLRELYPVVDRFVVVESVFTERGDRRHLVFGATECARRWAFAEAKITYVVNDDVAKNKAEGFPDRDWRFYHMAYIAGWKALTALVTVGADDLVIIGDLDEIVSAASVRQAVADTETRRWHTVSQFFMYTMNHCFSSDWPVPGHANSFRFPTLVRGSELDAKNERATIDARGAAYGQAGRYGALTAGGAHISWRAGVVELALKIRSNVEQTGRNAALDGLKTLDDVRALLADTHDGKGCTFAPQFCHRIQACPRTVWRPAWWLNNQRRYVF